MAETMAEAIAKIASKILSVISCMLKLSLTSSIQGGEPNRMVAEMWKRDGQDYDSEIDSLKCHWAPKKRVVKMCPRPQPLSSGPRRPKLVPDSKQSISSVIKYADIA